MAGCLALDEDGNGENAVLAGALQQEGGDEEGNKQGRDGDVDDENGNVNEEEEDDEDEDVDFNPFLKETNSLEASSSLSSEVEDLDADVADSGGKSKEKVGNVVGDCRSGVNIEHGEDIVLQTVVDVCEKGSGVGRGTATEKETVLITELNDKENGLASLADVTDSGKSVVEVDDEGAICMRTRARYSLASFSLDELETFLQETDDEDDLQNVDDEEEYRKFLAAVLRGDDSQSLQENANADDEEDEENDADFELELEEALESEPDEVEERRVTRRDRRQKASVERGKKPLGQLNRPLRPLLPFASAGSFPAFDGKHLAPNTAPTYLHTVNNGFTCGFTPHQIGQLHCLIHEHVQLLVQVFSVCVLEPHKRHVAAEVKEIILEMLRKRDQVLAWRTLPYPSFCFFPPYVHPSVPDELHKLPPNGSNKSLQQDFPSRSTGELQSDVIALPNDRYKHQPDGQTVSLQNLESNSWVPYICGPLMSVMDVAPLRLVESYIDDVSSAVQAYERYQIELGSENLGPKEPLFPLHNSSSPAESDGHGETENTPPGSSGTHSSSTCNQIHKKTMAATLIEKAKNQPVALVPKEIAKLAQRFWPLFNPTLYPHKPPPAPLANRVLFTDAEDELLALGLMEYNTDWKAIQQRFLPCKSKHQIFVRQKNRASSKAPENPIKAVRRMKNAPLTSEEMACIEVGLKKYKLDWISIWRFFVPYRDPSLLPRQWRIASGTQKSYKSDANKKAKRRLYELRRKSSKPSPSTLHYSCEKEGDSTDNGMEEANSGDNHMEKEDEAYVHEAFLADWRPDDNASSDYSTRLPFHRGSQTEGQRDNSGSGYIQSQMWSKSPATLRPSSSQIVLRPYRARKTNSASVVKLAPNLPPVNLPPSVRVISQSAFKSSQAEASTKISGNASRPGAENGTTNSACHYSVKSGHIGSNSFKITANNHQPKHSEVLIDKCVAGTGDPDLQMHPLLFQTPQDGRLPYYPLNCSPSTPGSFTFFPGKQPQLSLSLFHNPRHIRDAVNFLSKSSKPPEKNGSSFGVDFHPLLQRTDDVETVPSSTEPRQRCSSSGSGAKVGRKANELDLDIHLSFTSNNQEAAGSRDMSGNTASDPISKTIDFETAKVSSKKRDSAPDGNSNKVDSGNLAIITNREKGSRRVSDIADESSLPEIIMEQEELSDSEEEFGENVEFECEEMADSEGDSTSDSEQLVDIPDEEVQLDEIDADNGNHRVLNVQSDSGGNRCSTSNGLAENGVNNIKPNAQSLNLNSRPSVSPHSNPKNAVAGYEVGPFGTRGTFGQDKIPSNSKRSSRHVKKSDTQKRSRDAPDHPRKRACRSSSKSSNAVAGKGNTSSNMGTTIENSKNVSTDELS